MSFLETVGAAVFAAAVVGTFALLFSGRTRMYFTALAVWGVAAIAASVHSAGFQAGAEAEHAALMAMIGGDYTAFPILPLRASDGISRGLNFVMVLAVLPLLAMLPSLIRGISKRQGQGPADKGDGAHGD